MKIAFTSDLHCDVTPDNRRFAPHLVKAVESESPDVFIIAGDIANDLQSLEKALSVLGALPCRKLMVPGNHDLWVSKNAARKGKDSWHKYTSAIPEVCRKHGFECIATDPVVIDGIGFIGSVGWYDFSLRDPRLDGIYTERDYERGEFTDGRFPTGGWNDMRYARWLRHPESSDWKKRQLRLTTPDAFERVLDLFAKTASKIHARADALVAVVHTLPFAACQERRATPDPFDAYGGSNRLGELLVQLSSGRQLHCISGHQHRPLDVTVNDIRLLRSPVGYLLEPCRDLELKARETLGILRL